MTKLNLLQILSRLRIGNARKALSVAIRYDKHPGYRLNSAYADVDHVRRLLGKWRKTRAAAVP